MDSKTITCWPLSVPSTAKIKSWSARTTNRLTVILLSNPRQIIANLFNSRRKSSRPLSRNLIHDFRVNSLRFRPICSNAVPKIARPASSFSTDNFRHVSSKVNSSSHWLVLMRCLGFLVRIIGSFELFWLLCWMGAGPPFHSFGQLTSCGPPPFAGFRRVGTVQSCRLVRNELSESRAE